MNEWNDGNKLIKNLRKGQTNKILKINKWIIGNNE